MNVLVFNIKTVPDVQSARRLYALEGLQDKEVANVLYHKRMQESETENLQLHLSRVVAISICRRTDADFTIQSVTTVKTNEKDILETLCAEIDDNTQAIVSWNGHNYDIPVLRYRTLIHAVKCQMLDNLNKGFAANTASSRHISLMDVLSGSNQDVCAPLHELAVILGFPVHKEMDQTAIWDAYQNDNTQVISNHCDLDVLNTYLVYLRLLLSSGTMNDKGYAQEIILVKEKLQACDKPHFRRFLDAWM